MTEDELVEAIRPFTRGTGDDAALWQPSRSHRSVISTDMLVEGVDFTRDLMPLEDAGWRAMAANVSDLCAMGARPVLATVALGLSKEIARDDLLALYRGLGECAASAKLDIVGGDLSCARDLTIAIAVVGEVRPSDAKLRSDGRPGDVLAVTGPLGAARAGLDIARDGGAIGEDWEREALRAFRRPHPRVAEGRFLGASRNVTAMMDLSDGLSTDAARLALASGCAAEIESVPVAPAARALAERRKEDPQRFALAGGEDFELLVAVRPRAFAHVATRYAARFKRDLQRVGTLRKGSGVSFNGASLERSGWDHFSG